MRTTVSVARATLMLCVLPVSFCALRKSSLRVLVKPLSHLFCLPQTLSPQLTQFSRTQPLWPAPQSPLRAASQQLSPLLIPSGSPTLGCHVHGSLPAGQVQQVLFGPLPVQQQQLQQQPTSSSPQQQQQQQVQPTQQQQQVQAPFQSPPIGPRAGFTFSTDFKNRIWPN